MALIVGVLPTRCAGAVRSGDDEHGGLHIELQRTAHR